MTSPPASDTEAIFRKNTVVHHEQVKWHGMTSGPVTPSSDSVFPPMSNDNRVETPSSSAANVIGPIAHEGLTKAQKNPKNQKTQRDQYFRRKPPCLPGVALVSKVASFVRFATLWPNGSHAELAKSPLILGGDEAIVAISNLSSAGKGRPERLPDNLLAGAPAWGESVHTTDSWRPASRRSFHRPSAPSAIKRRAAPASRRPANLRYTA